MFQVDGNAILPLPQVQYRIRFLPFECVAGRMSYARGHDDLSSTHSQFQDGGAQSSSASTHNRLSAEGTEMGESSKWNGGNGEYYTSSFRSRTPISQNSESLLTL